MREAAASFAAAGLGAQVFSLSAETSGVAVMSA